MKAKLHPRLKLARIRHPWVTGYDDQNGAFRLMGPKERLLTIIASNGEGWDHVSVSIAESAAEIPTWEEMCFVKDLFFEPEEAAFQYHPPKSRYVNIDQGTLHIWRKQGEPLPMPPLKMV